MAYVYVMHPGNRLRELRKAAGLTQALLGDRVGMSQETLSLYENGKRPMTIEHMRALAREIGCATADLLDDVDNPERLTDEEAQMLKAFRQSAPSARDFLRTSAQAVAEQQSGYRAKSAA